MKKDPKEMVEFEFSKSLIEGIIVGTDKCSLFVIISFSSFSSSGGMGMGGKLHIVLGIAEVQKIGT